VTEVRQRNVALILARELAVNLATPMWVWDEQGTLVYHNERATTLVGGKTSDLGISQLDDISVFEARDLDGTPIDVADLPSAIALREKKPAHREIVFKGLDGVSRSVGVTAFPLFVRGDEFVGALTVFWELPNKD